MSPYLKSPEVRRGRAHMLSIRGATSASSYHHGTMLSEELPSESKWVHLFIHSFNKKCMYLLCLRHGSKHRDTR